MVSLHQVVSYDFHFIFHISYYLYLAPKIERLLRFCRPGADQDEKSHGDLYLEQAQEDIDDCTTRMRNIQQKFENWSETTLYLFKALGESQGMRCDHFQEKSVTHGL